MKRGSFLVIRPSVSPLAARVFSDTLGTCCLNTRGVSFLGPRRLPAPLPGPHPATTPTITRTIASKHARLFIAPNPPLRARHCLQPSLNPPQLTVSHCVNLMRVRARLSWPRTTTVDSQRLITAGYLSRSLALPPPRRCINTAPTHFFFGSLRNLFPPPTRRLVGLLPTTPCTTTTPHYPSVNSYSNIT